jgi:hypothetical protein
VGCWNTKSWLLKENENSNFRLNVLNSLDLDILCITESFLVGKEILSVENYSWYGRNRNKKHQNAKRGSGGVGILSKQRLLKYFNVTVLDNTKEDILWVNLASKDGGYSVCLCVCYLPPKTSSYKVEGDIFFDTLLEQIYCYQNEGIVCICGDINARYGIQQDYIEGVDDVKPREIIDYGENNYGDLFLDHLITTNMSMLNGRFNNNNGFTQISQKGKSVVDYVWTPFEQLHHYANFTVNSMSDIINKYDIVIPNAIPDHSVLNWQLLVPDNVINDVW